MKRPGFCLDGRGDSLHHCLVRDSECGIEVEKLPHVELQTWAEMPEEDGCFSSLTSIRARAGKEIIIFAILVAVRAVLQCSWCRGGAIISGWSSVQAHPCKRLARWIVKRSRHAWVTGAVDNSPSASARSTAPLGRKLAFSFALQPCPCKRARSAYVPSFSNVSQSLRALPPLQSSAVQTIKTQTWLQTTQQAGPAQFANQLCCVTFNVVRPNASPGNGLICGRETQPAADSIFLNCTQTSRSLHFRVWGNTHSLPPRRYSTVFRSLGSTWLETTRPSKAFIVSWSPTTIMRSH